MEIIRLKVQQIDLFKELLLVFQRVFQMKDIAYPEDSELQTLLSSPDFMVFVALEGKQVVGGLTVQVMHQYYYKEPIGHIYDLAVLNEFQRQGIASRLIKATCNHCKQMGFREVYVQADKIDDHALEFYRSTNPADEEDVSHFTYKLI
jgi:aminoglycoside 3-N-acetyltransferase I